jgi:2-C-methyl-D-erythritol 4-phosphate cytidylyltransferase
MRNYVVIPAGGAGLRSGFSKPKQYVKVNGKELIVYTLMNFQKCRFVDEIVIAASEQYFKLLNKLIIKYKLSKVTSVIEGGKERQDSVFNALFSLNTNSNDLILVHDAARPLLSASVLENAVKLAEEKGNAVVALKARDTLVKGAGSINSYLDRDEIYQIQTPQIFKASILKKAMLEAQKDNFYGTDESMLVKRIGKKVYLSEGSSLNFKVTTKEDFSLFKSLLG